MHKYIAQVKNKAFFKHFLGDVGLITLSVSFSTEKFMIAGKPEILILFFVFLQF